MKIAKLSMIALAATLVVGCATNGDIDNLQGQINDLKGSVDKASADAAAALSAANDASAKAAGAEAAANRAAQYAEETNSKLDSMFKKSMMK